LGPASGVNQRPKVHLYSGPTYMVIIFIPGQPYHKIDFPSFLSKNFLNTCIYSSKIINLGYNSIFLPGFVGKPFWEPVQLGPVPVLWFTPVLLYLSLQINKTHELLLIRTIGPRINVYTNI
jgi:hypothetical protein